MPKCFISYASEDQVIAEAVEKELRSHGYPARCCVWIVVGESGDTTPISSFRKE